MNVGTEVKRLIELDTRTVTVINRNARQNLVCSPSGIEVLSPSEQ